MTTTRRRIAVVGDGPSVRPVHAALTRREDVEVVRGTEACAGARVVVAAGGPVPLAVSRSTPDAVLVLVGGGPEVGAALATTLLPRARVLGTGGVAATSRLRDALGRAAGVAARDVTGLVLGAGPVASTLTIAGAPAEAVLGAGRLAEMLAAVREGTDDEHDLAAAVAAIVDAVLDDTRRVLACALGCHGEFGIGGSAVAVPVVVGAGGAEAVLELPLAEDELTALRRAAGA